MKVVHFILGAVLCLFSLSSFSGTIADYAITPITQKGYPKLYAQWGKAGVAKINSLLEPAAQMMANSSECDRLEYIDLSAARSKPKSSIVFFGDCANGKRFYVSDKEIAAKSTAVSQDSKSAGISDADLLKACREAIKDKLNFPSTFDPGWFGSSVYRAPAGRIVTSIDFEAKNAMGAALPHTGKCYVDGGATTSVEISPR